MRVTHLCALAILSSVGLLVAADDREGADKEGKKLQGKWVATSLRHGSTETPKEEIDKGAVMLTIDGDRFVFKTPKETHKGKIKIDSSRKTIDLLIPAKESKTKQILCIYEFAGDALRIAGDQEKRPKDFKSKLGGAIVVALKRAKD